MKILKSCAAVSVLMALTVSIAAANPNCGINNGTNKWSMYVNNGTNNKITVGDVRKQSTVDIKSNTCTEVDSSDYNGTSMQVDVLYAQDKQGKKHSISADCVAGINKSLGNTDGAVVVININKINVGDTSELKPDVSIVTTESGKKTKYTSISGCS